MNAWHSVAGELPTKKGLTFPPRTPVAIVEDNLDDRLLLERLLVRSRHLRCVGSYATGEEALKSPGLSAADVVLMDIWMPGLSGIDCARLLKKVQPNLKILMITGAPKLESLLESLRVGADGFLNKPVTETECCEAIQYALAGGVSLSKMITRELIDWWVPSVGCHLTLRENEVLKYISKGLRNKEIAHKLGVSIYDVQNCSHTIYLKLHVSNRAEAVNQGHRSNL